MSMKKHFFLSIFWYNLCYNDKGDNMKLFHYWEFWVLMYLISAIVFAHSFRKANRNMKNASALTILLELTTAFFAILFIPFSSFKMAIDISTYVTLFFVMIIYAITDRLNMEARYGLDPSVFSMLKQLSTVFMIFLGLFILKEPFIIHHFLGAIIIIFANLILTFNKGKVRINRYFIMCFFSNLLFAIAMLINVHISDQFNLALYTFFTVFFPAIFIFSFGRHSLLELKEEYQNYNQKAFWIAGFTWFLMLISSVRAYQLGNVVIVAPLFSLTSLLNAIIEYLFYKNKKQVVQKLIASILLIIGVILVKI